MDASTKINIPESANERIVIVGGGFGGLQMARKLSRDNYQVVLIDKNNYHQFQPLFYQVAMAGLEPSSIVFPFRKLFQGKKNIYIRVTEVTRVEPTENKIYTPLGFCNYDHLIIATGADTNYFGNERIAEHALPMKSVAEALYLRNNILDDYEDALTTPDYDPRQELVDIVIVGGGPTGVELAGSLAEMKKHVLPKDYPELNIEEEVDVLTSPAISATGPAKKTSFLSPTATKEAWLQSAGPVPWWTSQNPSSNLVVFSPGYCGCWCIFLRSSEPRIRCS